MTAFVVKAWSYFHPDQYDVEANLEAVAEQINDPFHFGDAAAYHEGIYHWTETQCMESMVAGISQSLGLPQGLSFEEVFARIV